MQLVLSKPLVVFDIEATGVQIGKDRMVEIALLKIFPNGEQSVLEYRINPEIPIPLEISEIHGIYDVDVINAPKLEEVADTIIDFIQDCDLSGYNCKKFDIPFLIEELGRVNRSIDISSVNIIDVQNIFHKKEQRTLSAAYMFYCGEELVEAHSALADARATYNVLEAQLKKYDDLEKNASFLSNYSEIGAKTVDFARRIGLDNEGQPIFNFGKHKGKTVTYIFSKDPNYYNWIMNGEFAKETKDRFTEIWNKMKLRS